MSNFWDFSVWGVIILLGTLFLGLIAGHMIKRAIPVLKDSLIPTSVIGGALLLIISAIFEAVSGRQFFNEAIFGSKGTSYLEILTYHCLALGFIASALKKNGSKGDKKRLTEIFNTGVATVANYLLQALFGFGITLLVAFYVKDFFKASGLLLPFGYGQGTGQALNYGNIYETQFGFIGGKTFGLSIAALGFLSAGIGGVIHLIFLKRKGLVKPLYEDKTKILLEEIQSDNEIPMQESMDKASIQLAFIAIAYIFTYIIMVLLGNLLPGMRAVIFGFNFLLGVLSAVLLKAIINFLHNKRIIKREYLNNFLLTRASNSFFDLMVVAGIAAIDLSTLQEYWLILLILGLVGAVTTFIYDRIIVKALFKDYAEEQFLMMYGMYTGTASTGVILLREIDPNFETPAADNMVYQNFPAIIFGFPMMLLATMAPVKPLFTYLLLILFFIAMNIILFRSLIFKKKNK